MHVHKKSKSSQKIKLLGMTLTYSATLSVASVPAQFADTLITGHTKIFFF
jgi:hypothetical protein